jgi:uncharacterized membrane protein
MSKSSKKKGLPGRKRKRTEINSENSAKTNKIISSLKKYRIQILAIVLFLGAIWVVFDFRSVLFLFYTIFVFFLITITIMDGFLDTFSSVDPIGCTALLVADIVLLIFWVIASSQCELGRKYIFSLFHL